MLMFMFGLILYFVQDGMIYMPRAYGPIEVKNWKAEGLRQIDFETGQGEQGAFYQAPKTAAEPRRIWLVFGGNGGRAVDYREVAADADCGYLFVDLPGYGLCEGKPNPKRIDETVDAAIAALQEQLGMTEKQCQERLCVVGHSLGGAVGLRAAVRHQIGRVVLLAPFTTMKAMASRVVGGLYANVLRHRFDNVRALEALQAANPEARVTIINGTDDREVPPAMGKELAERFEKISDYRCLDGVGHNDIFDWHLQDVLDAMAAE